MLANPLCPTQSTWTKVFDAWKELCTALYRGYTNYGFENWTLPCLYTAGRYLRIFAMRADQENSQGSDESNAAMLQDDFDPDAEKSSHMEDCARVLNRMFTLCLSDR